MAREKTQKEETAGKKRIGRRNVVAGIAAAAGGAVAAKLVEAPGVQAADGQAILQGTTGDAQNVASTRTRLRSFAGVFPTFALLEVDATPDISSGTAGVWGRASGGNPGVTGAGGPASGAGVEGSGGGPNGTGIYGIGAGLGSGVYGSGGIAAGAGGRFLGGGTSGTGVVGTGGGPNGYGVSGTGTGAGTGVSGSSTAGAGVTGSGATFGTGGLITGFATISVGSTNGAGVVGVAQNNAQAALAGWFSGQNGWGALGYVLSGASGSGVAGLNAGTGPGVWGSSQSAWAGNFGNAAGVLGLNTNDGPGVAGVSTNGIGVYGYNEGSGDGDPAACGGFFTTSANNTNAMVSQVFGNVTNAAAFLGVAVPGGGRLAGYFSGDTRFLNGDAFFQNNVTVQGNHTVTGTKSAAVPMADGRLHKVYAVEAPESWFEDYGEASMTGNSTFVPFPADFAQVVDTSKYHVFLTPTGAPVALSVESRTPQGFTVSAAGRGASGFSYRIVAKRKDVAAPRFDGFDAPTQANIRVPFDAPPPAPAPGRRGSITLPASAAPGGPVGFPPHPPSSGPAPTVPTKPSTDPGGGTTPVAPTTPAAPAPRGR